MDPVTQLLLGFPLGIAANLGAELLLKLEKGKEAIFTGEQQRLKEIPGWDAVKEYEIPQLLAKDENLTVGNFSDHRIEAPGRPESHHFMGAKYLERGFIGRRQVLRVRFGRWENCIFKKMKLKPP